MESGPQPTIPAEGSPRRREQAAGPGQLTLGDQPSGSFCPTCLAPVTPSEESCVGCAAARPTGGWPGDPLHGRMVGGKYRLETRLGSGGFGLVYRARQMQGEIDLGHVVVKFLHREMVSDARVRQRLLTEAQAARRLHSPHVVKIFDLAVSSDGLPYLVMEYLSGQTLSELLDEQGALAPGRALAIALQVASALQECHARGIVHRDLKPANLLLLSNQGAEKDFVKVIDFGIARLSVPSGTASQATFVGTPRYMAPERILHQHADERSDIFSLGVMLYECLAGRSPIEASAPMEYLRLNLQVCPTPLRERVPDAPVALERLIAAMMAKQPDQRPPSMADVAARLRAIGQACDWVAPPVTEAASAVSATTADLDDDEPAIPPLAPSRDRGARRQRLAYLLAALGLIFGVYGLFSSWRSASEGEARGPGELVGELAVGARQQAKRSGEATPGAAPRGREVTTKTLAAPRASPAPPASLPVAASRPTNLPVAASQPTKVVAPKPRRRPKKKGVKKGAAKKDWGQAAGGL